MIKIVQVFKLKQETETGYIVKGQAFGDNEAEFLGYSHTKETEPGEYNHYIGENYGDYVYGVFNKEIKGLTEAEADYLMDALRGYNFYTITEYKAIEVNDCYIPLDIIDSCGGFHILDADDLEAALLHFTNDITNVKLAIEDAKTYLNDISDYAEKIGVSDILEIETIEIFK